MVVETDLSNTHPTPHRRDGLFERETFGDLAVAELLHMAVAGLGPVQLATAEIKHKIDIAQPIPGELAVTYARLVAEYALGIEAMLQATGVDRARALTEIIMTRGEKYSEVYETYRKELEDEGVDPTNVAVKGRCRQRWGKFQLTLNDDRYAVLQDARRAYAEMRASGMSPAEAHNAAWSAFSDEAYSIPYATDAGTERVLDLRRYTTFEPDLPDLVTTSATFEQGLGQGIVESISQVRAEIIEVQELLGFTHGESDKRLEARFASIDDFRAHLEVELSAGRLSAEEYDRYYFVESIPELREYVVAHLPYELLDVEVAASGVLGWLNADMQAAMEKAYGKRRATYAAPIQALRTTGNGSAIAGVTPRVLKRALREAQEASGVTEPYLGLFAQIIADLQGRTL